MAEERERPEKAADLSKDRLIEMYRDMLLQRRFEESAARAYGMGRIYGFCHLYIGQEAISTGTAHAMGPDDIMVSAYRIHAQALAMGMDPQAAMDELFGRATGCTSGMGGSMHLYDIDKGFWGGWGLVGQQVPMGTGIAMAQKYRETGAVTVTFFGDGAIHQGAVHEAFNMASVWKLPIVYVVENNGYGMGTAVSRVSSLEPLHGLASVYKMEHRDFDGMDVLASYEAMREAIEYARSEQKPIFVEARCSRFRGHSMSDPGKYRSKDQLEEEKGRDPIPKLASHLLDRELVSQDDLDGWDKDTRARMKDVLKNAEDAPWPDESEITTHVYAD